MNGDTEANPNAVSVVGSKNGHNDSDKRSITDSKPRDDSEEMEPPSKKLKNNNGSALVSIDPKQDATPLVASASEKTQSPSAVVEIADAAVASKNGTPSPATAFVVEETSAQALCTFSG